jgi:hypothetical protein
MPKLKWFDRSFRFDFPVEVYPDVIERLRGTPARVEEQVRTLERDVLVRRDGDTWSIQENVGHLLDLETLHDGRIDDFLTGAARLRPADLQNRATNEARHNSRAIDSILQDFRTARGHFVARLESLAEPDFARISEHPRLKQPMRLVDFLSFNAQHDDYHLARISELIRMFQHRNA